MIKIVSVKLDPQTVEVGGMIQVEVKLIRNDWEHVKDSHADWQKIKSNYGSWLDLKYGGVT